MTLNAQSRNPVRRVAVIGSLVVVGVCAAACSGFGPAGTPGQREYASRQYAAMRHDSVFDIQVPGGVPGKTFTAPGQPGDSNHPGYANVGGRTWKVKHPDSGLLTVLIQELKAHGVTFDSAMCGRNLIVHGLQKLGPGNAGVYLILNPYPVAAASAITVQVQVDTAVPNTAPDPLTQESNPVLPPTSATPNIESRCAPTVSAEIVSAYR